MRRVQKAVSGISHVAILACLPLVATLSAQASGGSGIKAQLARYLRLAAVLDGVAQDNSSAIDKIGAQVYSVNCALCHGDKREGNLPAIPSLIGVVKRLDDSRLTEQIVHGQGRMPAFPNLGKDEVVAVVHFLHIADMESLSATPSKMTEIQTETVPVAEGRRREVDVADLQTGNLEAGKAFFNGAAGCSGCHSATGNLAGVATKYKGLQLEQRMLVPRDVKSKATVTLPGGKVVTGTLVYQDEFTLALRDADGVYHSWSRSSVQSKIELPTQAHIDLLPKYTDDDVHNLMAYLQTMR